MARYVHGVRSAEPLAEVRARKSAVEPQAGNKAPPRTHAATQHLIIVAPEAKSTGGRRVAGRLGLKSGGCKRHKLGNRNAELGTGNLARGLIFFPRSEFRVRGSEFSLPIHAAQRFGPADDRRFGADDENLDPAVLLPRSRGVVGRDRLVLRKAGDAHPIFRQSCLAQPFDHRHSPGGAQMPVVRIFLPRLASLDARARRCGQRP